MSDGVRPDLLALTADGLAALSNRGLVKRAAREIEAGTGPAVTVDEDGTIRGRFPDGVEVALPRAVGLEAASCSCPATGLCRHRIAVVLAYQQASAATAGTAVADEAQAQVVRWSPGEFTDDDLEAALGSRLLAVARRTHRSGYSARVRRPTAADPVPTVELAACTVRFLVPHELGYVHSDAARGVRDDVVALAVWAFREADERAPSKDDVHVEVGGVGAATAAADGSVSGLEPALDVVHEVLLDGAVHAGTGLVGTIASVRRRLDAAHLYWPMLALDDLADQLDAYRSRSARYEPRRLADLANELHARHRAVTARRPRTRVLGTEEAAETPLRRVRLVSLGCRITGTSEDRTAEVFLAEAHTGIVVVLRRRWPVAEGEDPTGPALTARRLGGGVALGALATGNLVTESGARSASRLVRLASNRVAKTMAAPCTPDAWAGLPPSVLIRDTATVTRSMEDLPPRAIRPRIEAEFVRALEIAEVVRLGYRPGDQRLDAWATDPAGGSFRIVAPYRSIAPGGLDALAAALLGERGAPRFVSGAVHRTGGEVVVDPLAVFAGTTMVVPDLAPGDGTGTLDLAGSPEPDPLIAGLDAALDTLADAAHRGLRHLPPSFAARLQTAAAGLARTGLTRAAAAVDGFRTTLADDAGPASIEAWVDAYLRLSVTAEAR